MKVVVSMDERTHLVEAVLEELQKRGHEVKYFGPEPGKEAYWPDVTLQAMGASHQPTDKPEIDRIIADVRVQLEDEVFQIAWTNGQRVSLEQAVANALEED